MKTFLIFLVLAYAKPEKLDLTYLPPPGSQYAGGRPEDIQVPLEFPKETYTTTLRPQDFESGITNPEDYQATIGINRGLPTDTLVASDVTPGPKAPFSYLQNTYKVPTTTISYAFTQTTTHPPTEGFETTIGPQFDGTGFLSQDIFNNFQPQESSLTYQGNLDQPGYKNQVAQNRPGYQQNISQFSGQRPVAPTSGPISQYTGPTAQPQGTVSVTEKDFQTQNKPGYKPSEYQFREQNPAFATTADLANNKQNLEIIGENSQNQLPSYPNKPQPGPQQPISEVRPGIQYGQTQYQNQTVNEGGIVHQPDFVSSIDSSQDLLSTPRPGFTYDNRPNNIQGFSSTLRPNSPQTSYRNQVQPGQIVNNERNLCSSKQPGSQLIGEPYYGNRQNNIEPSSTVVPSTFTPSIQNGQILTGTSDVPEIYSNPVYTEAQYNNQADIEPSIYRPSPERPQADKDRNAVILNYENVITPEGFAYSFDTSNGIHADESGTAINGVKAQGSYSYIGDDGKLYSVVYTADENGYRPHGDHLPTPPPIPEAIQAIIEKVKKEKEAGIYHDGSYDDEKYGYKKYQGTMHHGPQHSNKVSPNGVGIPKEFINDTFLPDMKPSRPLSGIRKPTVSSGDLSDFDVENEEQRQNGDNENDNDDEKISHRISVQRPINSAIHGEEMDGNMQDGSDQNQYFEVSSKRPFKQPTKKLTSKIKSFNRDDNIDRGRPGDKIDFQKVEDQEYGSEKPYYEDDASKTPVSTKGYSTRPTIQNRPQYDKGHKTSTGSFEYDNSSKRPLTPGSSRRPEKNSPEQSFDEYKNTRPLNFSGRRPSNRPVIGNIQDRFQPDEQYNIQKDGTQSFFTQNYEDEEYVTKSPSRIQSDDTKPSLTSASRNQTTYTRRRPDFIPERSEAQNEDVEYQPDDDKKYISSGEFQNKLSLKYGVRRPLAGNPTIPNSGKYKETEQDFNENLPQRGYNDRSQPTFANYGGTRARPQTPLPPRRPLGKPQYSNQDNRGQVLIGDKKTNIPVAEFGQKLIKPYNYQQTSQTENVDFNKQPINEYGYQYIPPQKKFEQDESNRLPVMFTGTSKVTSTMQPPHKSSHKDVKSKPFITPNVSRDDTEFTVDEYDQEEGSPEVIHGEDQEQQNRFNTQNPDSATTPDQIFGEEIISSTKPPNKYTSSSYAPSLPTRQPLRPQYHQNTQNLPGFKNNVVPIENQSPAQDTDRINGYKYTKVPYGGVSSTTPLQSNDPNYESTYGSTTPEELNNYVTGNTYQTPSQGLVSSTTPLPSSQQSTFDGSYQQNTNGPQYQTTFRPSETLIPTTNFMDGSTAQRLPPVSSTYSKSKVGPYENTQYGNDLPSTTYRPNFAITGTNEPTTTAIPGTVVDGFGRPIRPGYSSTVQDYSPGSSGQPIIDQSTKVRYQPGGSPGEPFRGPQKYNPGTKLGQQRVTPTFQSTTQKIIREDFSGPKQQQKFDPETGYYY